MTSTVEDQYRTLAAQTGDPNKATWTARIVGLLILASYAGLFIGNAMLGSLFEGSGDLAAISADSGRVMTGVLLELVNDAVIIGIAVLLFPFLKRYGEGIALGYIAFRVIESALYVVGKASALSLIDLSQDYVAAGAPDPSFYLTARDAALSQQHWSGQLAAYAFMVGGLLLYALLYRSQLVPRFISIWGVAGIVSLIAANVFAVPDLTQGFEPAMVLYFPIVLNELFLAGWLLVKGFNLQAPESRSRALDASTGTDVREVRSTRPNKRGEPWFDG